MFKKGTWFKIGWLYLPVMFILEMILPTWTGDENGPIENLQLLWLFWRALCMLEDASAAVSELGRRF